MKICNKSNSKELIDLSPNCYYFKKRTALQYVVNRVIMMIHKTKARHLPIYLHFNY